jgi:EAL domain-containing protein (putative c-di-GMP-specific phosphodiesterase class I)
MYVAKEGGRNRFQFFDPSMNSHLLERLALEAGMRRALAKESFRVHFQPKVDARDGSLLGMEALVRWDDPDIGTVSPAKFIPVAEETGLIVELGEFVLLYALNFNKTLQEDGFPPIRVGVNLSSVQMKDPQILTRVERCLTVSGLNPKYLELEVTEGILLEGSGRALTVLNDLKAMGITLALDDFGTGYSSLGYLNRYPFKVLKIDQSFVRTLLEDPQSRSLASAIIVMGRSLGLELIAEGVEKPEQAAFLSQEGCHAAQGYLYGRPMDPDAFRAFYREKLNVAKGRG